MGEAWPYGLPIFRRMHRAASPDGRFIAEIDPAWEVSMSNPTRGALRVSSGLVLEGCNPSFVWSDDSRYVAVPRYFTRWGLLRMQRLVVLDVIERRALASRETAFYFQPESFLAGILIVTKEPFHRPARIVWRVPEDLARLSAIPIDRCHE